MMDAEAKRRLHAMLDAVLDAALGAYPVTDVDITAHPIGIICAECGRWTHPAKRYRGPGPGSLLCQDCAPK